MDSQVQRFPFYAVDVFAPTLNCAEALRVTTFNKASVSEADRFILRCVPVTSQKSYTSFMLASVFVNRSRELKNGERTHLN